MEVTRERQVGGEKQGKIKGNDWFYSNWVLNPITFSTYGMGGNRDWENELFIIRDKLYPKLSYNTI